MEDDAGAGWFQLQRAAGVYEREQTVGKSATSSAGLPRIWSSIVDGLAGIVRR